MALGTVFVQNPHRMTGTRLCPLCDRQMEEVVCPTHGVPTLAASVFQPSDEKISIGSVLGERRPDYGPKNVRADSPEVRRLIRRIRRASAGTIRLLNLLATALERS